MSSKVKGFFAYPANPADIGQTIEQAISQTNSLTSVQVDSWKALDIVGHFIAEEVTEGIDGCDFFLADISVLNFNVTYEIFCRVACVYR